MPVMPEVDPWQAIKVLLKAESDIRGNTKVDLGKLELDPYWADFVRLLQIFRHYKNKEGSELARIKGEMSSHVYSAYIEKHMRKHAVAHPPQGQFDLLIS